MPTLGGVSGNALASLVQVQKTPATTAGAAASAKAVQAVNTADTVVISAETKAELAGGKPFFATAGATGTATDETDGALGTSERVGKEKRVKQGAPLEAQATRTADQTSLQLERTKKRGGALQDKVGTRLLDEKTVKGKQAAVQQDVLGKNEARTKQGAADKTKLLTERAEKRGVPVDQARLDRIQGGVKDEAARKRTRLDSADGRRLASEERAKRVGRKQQTGTDLVTEQQIKRTSTQGDAKLSKIEERMKRLDPVRDDGGETRIKAAATPTAPDPTAADATVATTRDVI